MQVQNLYISMVILLCFEIFDFVMIIFDLSNDLLIYTCVARATLLVLVNSTVEPVWTLHSD
jgi:hypothetical protein